MTYSDGAKKTLDPGKCKNRNITTVYLLGTIVRGMGASPKGCTRATGNSDSLFCLTHEMSYPDSKMHRESFFLYAVVMAILC